MFGGQNNCAWMNPTDRLVMSECELPVAAHVVPPRRGYTHHGIYVGEGRVVHYGGGLWGLRRGPVEEVSMPQFSQGHPIAHRWTGLHGFERDEVVRRARGRLGEDRYNVFTNNCEHFCEWCVRDEHRSYQVDAGIAFRIAFWRRVVDLAGSFPAFDSPNSQTKQRDQTIPTLTTCRTGVHQHLSVRDTIVQSRIA
jgi:Lecithin retinol acyltransferase